MENILPRTIELVGMRMYLSGPMTGYKDFNYPKFNEVATKIRNKYGASVFNPATNFEGRTDLPRKTYMREDIEQVLQAEAIVLLDGWEKSKGARLEYEIALELEIPIYKWDEKTQMLLIHTGTRAPEFESATAHAHAPREKEIGEAAPATAHLNEASIHITDDWEDFWVNSEDFNGGKEDIQLPHKEAESLVLGDRQSAYGHPLDNFSANAHMWTGTLYYKLRDGEIITPEDVALMMLQVKVAREINVEKRDNIVDAHGYLMTYDMVKRERKNRAMND